jgi:uncharacterized membrane protein YjfL (UPF0719 family)
LLSGEAYMQALLIKQAAKASMGLLLAFLFFQIALPKSGLQTEIFEENNVAAAIVVLGIILGVCLA